MNLCMGFLTHVPAATQYPYPSKTAPQCVGTGKLG